jgi:hypothetical protein
MKKADKKDRQREIKGYAAVDLIEGRSQPESHPRRRRAGEVRTCSKPRFRGTPIIMLKLYATI